MCGLEGELCQTLNVTSSAHTGLEAVIVREVSTLRTEMLYTRIREDAFRARPHPAKLLTCEREPETLGLYPMWKYRI